MLVGASLYSLISGLCCFQSQFENWRNTSSVMKVQTRELEQATDSVVTDANELGESVSKV